MRNVVRIDTTFVANHTAAGYCGNCKIVGPVFEGVVCNQYEDEYGAWVCSRCEETEVTSCIACDDPSVCDDLCHAHSVEFLADNPQDIEHWISLGGHYAVIANLVMEAA